MFVKPFLYLLISTTLYSQTFAEAKKNLQQNHLKSAIAELKKNPYDFKTVKLQDQNSPALTGEISTLINKEIKSAYLMRRDLRKTLIDVQDLEKKATQIRRDIQTKYKRSLKSSALVRKKELFYKGKRLYSGTAIKTNLKKISNIYTYKRGKEISEISIYYDDDHLREIRQYETDKKGDSFYHGLNIEYNKNNFKRITEYKADKINGLDITYNDHGTLDRIYIRKGQNIEIHFHENGIPSTLIKRSPKKDRKLEVRLYQNSAIASIRKFNKFDSNSYIPLDEVGLKKSVSINEKNLSFKDGTIITMIDSSRKDQASLKHFHSNGLIRSETKTGQERFTVSYNNQKGQITLRNRGTKKDSKIKLKKNFSGKLINHKSSKGKTLAEAQYKNGRLDGLETHYYLDGSKRMEIHYKNGYKDGPLISYYPNGAKFSEAHYKKNIQTTKTKIFFETGELAYDDDSAINQPLYYRNGQICYLRAKTGGITTQKKFYANGQLSEEIVYDSKTKISLRTRWFPKGQKKYSETISQPSAEILKEEWFINGQKKKLETYKNDKRHGRYAKWNYNGWIIEEGHYSNGKQEGLCKRYKFNKILSESHYLNGIQDGLRTYYHHNGNKKEEGNARENRPNGPWKFWDKNGKLTSKGHFKDGDKSGSWTEYYQDSTIKANYSNGRRHGKFLEISPGNKTEGQYDNGKKTGLWVYKRSDGITHQTYKDSRAHGPYIYKDKKGKILEKGEYVNGKREGKWVTRSGTKIYKKGSIVK